MQFYRDEDSVYKTINLGIVIRLGIKGKYFGQFGKSARKQINY